MREEADTELQQPAMDERLLEGVDRPGRWTIGGGHQGDLEARTTQHLGEDRAEIIMIVIEYDDGAGRHAALHEVIGREYSRSLEPGDRRAMRPPDAVAAPGRAGREYHAARAELEHVLRADLAFKDQRHFGHLPQLIQAIIAHACPGGESRQARLARHTSAELGPRLHKVHAMATAPEHARAFESRGAGSDYQEAIVADAGG